MRRKREPVQHPPHVAGRRDRFGTLWMVSGPDKGPDKM